MVVCLCWAGVNDFDPQVMMALFPLTSWHRAKPMPWRRDASEEGYELGRVEVAGEQICGEDCFNLCKFLVVLGEPLESLVLA